MGDIIVSLSKGVDSGSSNVLPDDSTDGVVVAIGVGSLSPVHDPFDAHGGIVVCKGYGTSVSRGHSADAAGCSAEDR